MRTTLVLLVLVGLTIPAFAQELLLPTTPVPAGSTVSALVVPGPGSVVCSNTLSLRLLSPSGDLITPRFDTGGSTWSCASGFPGLPMTIQVPATGPGSSGSFVVYFPHPPGIAGRLDVGTPSPSFPAIHTFPAGIHFGLGGHAVFPELAATTPNWCFVNASAAPHTFGPGDHIRICTPGGTVPVTTLPISGLFVPAGRRVMLTLPVSGLPPDPFTVEVFWNDPAVGALTRSIGIHASTLGDLHVPGGRVVPLGGSIEAYLEFSFPPGLAPLAALMIGTQPGSTPLPDNEVVPLVAEPLVLASLSGGLGSVLQGSPAFPIPLGFVFCGGYCAPTQLPGFILNGIHIAHPGAAYSGMRFRLAGIARDVITGRLCATQGEDIVLE